MSLHIEAKADDIAKTIFITGDPLRAKYYAEKWLTNSTCYNRIRGMLGYTGTYKGKRISIQGTGIGIPSTALYLHELTHTYKVNCVMRLGTCGAIQRDLKLGEVILATEAFTDSAAVQSFLISNNSLPKPSNTLIQQTEHAAVALNIALRKGAIFSTDLFYSEDLKRYDSFIRQGVLGVDMETSLLYAMANRYKIQSISLLTISDNILNGIASSAEDREKHADDMIRLALEVAYSQES